VDEVVQAWEQARVRAKADQAIQASQLTNANPWLRMTRWADYLQGIQAHDLLASMAALEEDPMDATEQQVQVIWDTMEQVARKSQQTVQHCGQAIQVEAVRSEKGQTPHRPLLAYMDEAAIKKHVQPWQQILAFIARTQAPHNWTSPKYRMTARQRQKWRQLWQLASQAPRSPVPQGLTDPTYDPVLRPLIGRSSVGPSPIRIDGACSRPPAGCVPISITLCRWLPPQAIYNSSL
jgi:hypothetical protein